MTSVTMGRMDEESAIPICRKCGKPVEGFTRGKEFRRGNVCFFESRCHGEKERIEYWPLNREGALFVPAYAFPADRPSADLATLENPGREKNVLDFEHDLREMPEWKRLSRIEHFAVSTRLLERNAQELTAALHFLTADDRSWPLSDIKRRADLDRAFEEVLRLLHNFVAAAFTLVDHSRVLYGELYEDTGLFPDYRAEVDRRFASEPLVQFVQKLRQLAQHVRLPAVSYHLEDRTDLGIRRRLALSKSDLLQFKGWAAPAKVYLAAAAEQIDLSEVVEAYVNQVRAFYEWMEKRQREIHAPDVAAVEKVQAEARALLAKKIPRLLELDLANWTAGLGSLQDVFGFAFGPDDWVELSRYDGDLVAWTEAAISMTEERFGSLPEDLAARIREAARRGKQG